MSVDIPPEKDRRRRLSYSSASLYRQCPRRWWWQYIKGVRSPDTLASMVGGVAHSILEAVFKLPGKERTLDTAQQIAKDEWENVKGGKFFTENTPTEQELKEFKQAVWSGVEGVWRVEDPTLVDVVGVEEDLEVEILGVPIKGVIDRIERVNGSIIIGDYKTGALPKRREYLEAKFEQLYWYAAVLKSQMGFKAESLKLIFSTHGKVYEKEASARVVNPAIMALKRTWDELQESVETDVYEPRTGPLCCWCSVINECPEGMNFMVKWIEAGRNVRDDAVGLVIMREALRERDAGLQPEVHLHPEVEVTLQRKRKVLESL